MTAASALRRVSALYNAALELPHPFTEETSEELPDVEPPSGSVALVNARAAKLPFGIDWMVFDPLGELPEDPVGGSLLDDLGDIHRDVARGLALFDSGERAEALSRWGFHSRTHWGEHAIDALWALHRFVAKAAPDDFSKPAGMGG